jgi:hypothetical protein
LSGRLEAFRVLLLDETAEDRRALDYGPPSSNRGGPSSSPPAPILSELVDLTRAVRRHWASREGDDPLNRSKFRKSVQHAEDGPHSMQ